MVFFGVILGIGILSAMVYLALDKKSTFQIRIASLIAIAIMMLTVILCVFIVLTDTRVPVDESVLIVGAPVETKKDGGGNTMVLLLLIIFMVVIFVFLAILSMHENRKHIKKDGDNKGKSGLIS
jgi:heme/copper-type cytochrome/quinol oxidase subunit 4